MKPSSSVGIRHYRSALRIHTGISPSIPLLDLFFLLLIFILMASSMTRVSGISVELPRLPSESISISGALMVTIVPQGGTKNCQIYFQDAPCSPEDLRQRFSRLPNPEKQRLIIRADREVPSGVLDEVIALAQAENLPCLLAVDPPDDAPEANFE